jgi:hypothetical protein
VWNTDTPPLRFTTGLPHDYRPLHLFFLFAAECGIVNTLASPLSRVGINLFYLSTFETDLIFVPVHLVTEAMDVLLKHGFRCVEEAHPPTSSNH